MRPLNTLGEKEKILNKVLKEKGILFFEHDPQIECCSLQLTDKGIRHQSIIKIDEL